MQTNYILWEYFINFLEVVLFYILMQSKLTSKKDCAHIQTKQFIYLLLRWLILCVLNMTDFSSMVILAISYIIEISFALIFYDDAFLIRFFWGSMYTIISLVADYLTLFIPQTFSHITSPDLLMGGALRMPFSLLYIALTTVLGFPASLYVRQENPVICNPEDFLLCDLHFRNFNWSLHHGDNA